MAQRSLLKVLHDASFRLNNYLNGLDKDTRPFNIVEETLADLRELLERGVGINPVPVNTDILADMSECEAGIAQILYTTVGNVPFHQSDLGKKLLEVQSQLRTIRIVVELEPISDLKQATLEQTGPTIVLHEMELWELRTDHLGRTVLCDGSRSREGVDPETDTYPLTMGRINYSLLFQEQWQAWCSDNEDRPFANRSNVERKVLALWRQAMAEVGDNPAAEEPGPQAYRLLIRFLEELDEAGRRLQRLLVQDIPVFERDTTSRQSA